MIFILLLCLGTTAATDSTNKTVDITCRDIRIVVNGTEITPCDVTGNLLRYETLLNGPRFISAYAYIAKT